jgi:regulator of nucleoside diphosphate kinase
MLPTPKVTVSAVDYKRLHVLLESFPESKAVDRLIDELERAEVVTADKMPADVVTMHSRVTFTVLSTQKTFTYKLVYPHETTTADTLSVLTPVGSALLGLSIGQEIEWPLEGGKSTQVRIDAIPKY